MQGQPLGTTVVAPASSALTAARLIAQAQAMGLARLDAQLLVGHALGLSRAALIARDDEAVSPQVAQALHEQFERRLAGVPLAYLVGEREFHGLRLQVGPAVLVPRPETETLVDWALEWLHGPLAPLSAPRVLDLGTGSGAIALALKARCPRAQVHAVERSERALAVARANAQRMGLEVQWWLGDWLQALPPEAAPFDLIVSNPPYIDAEDPHLAALHAEPREALSPGPDGLAALAHIARTAPAHTAPGGALLLEHGYTQGPAVRALLQQCGWQGVMTRPDLAGVERCTGGQRAAAPPG